MYRSGYDEPNFTTNVSSSTHAPQPVHRSADGLWTRSLAKTKCQFAVNWLRVECRLLKAVYGKRCLGKRGHENCGQICPGYEIMHI